MGDEDHRAPQLLPDRQEIVVEPKTCDFIERGERLIHQQQLRLGDERARNRGAHFHAARKFAREGSSKIREPDAIKGLLHGCV